MSDDDDERFAFLEDAEGLPYAVLDVDEMVLQARAFAARMCIASRDPRAVTALVMTEFRRLSRDDGPVIAAQRMCLAMSELAETFVGPLMAVVGRGRPEAEVLRELARYRVVGGPNRTTSDTDRVSVNPVEQGDSDTGHRASTGGGDV